MAWRVPARGFAQRLIRSSFLAGVKSPRDGYSDGHYGVTRTSSLVFTSSSSLMTKTGGRGSTGGFTAMATSPPIASQSTYGSSELMTLAAGHDGDPVFSG